MTVAFPTTSTAAAGPPSSSSTTTPADRLSETCYVLDRSGGNDNDGSSHGEEESNWVPLLGGAEPARCVRLRREAFERAVARVERAAQAIVERRTAATFRRLMDFVQQPPPPQQQSQQQPLFSTVRTALLTTGINVADLDLIVRQFAALHARERADGSRMAVLRAEECASVKHMVRLIVQRIVADEMALDGEEDDDSEAEADDDIEDEEQKVARSTTLKLTGGRNRLASHDLQLLRAWCEHAQPGRRGSLIVFIPDFERLPHAAHFDALVRLLAGALDAATRSRVVLLLGLATGADAFAFAQRPLLETARFELETSGGGFDDLLEELFLAQPAQPQLGFKAYEHVYNAFHEGDLSVSNALRAVRYLLMAHYYGKPWSFLLEENDQNYYYPELLEALRMEPSFRQLMAAGGDAGSRSLLTDDDALRRQVLAWLAAGERHARRYHAALRCLMLAQAHVRKAAFRRTLGRLHLFMAEGRLRGSEHVALVLRLVRAFALPRLLEFVRAVQSLFADSTNDDDDKMRRLAARFAFHGARLQRLAVRTARGSGTDEAATGSAFHDEQAELQTLGEASLSQPAAALSSKAGLLQALEAGTRAPPLKEQQRASKTSRRAEASERAQMDAAETPENAAAFIAREDNHEPSVEEVRRRVAARVAELLAGEVLDGWLRSYRELPLHELRYVGGSAVAESAFAPQPRAAVHTALAFSHFYLGCRCCRPADNSNAADYEPISRATEDAAVAYRTHLDCGRLINVYDWYRTFFYLQRVRFDKSVGQASAATTPPKQKQKQKNAKIMSPSKRPRLETSQEADGGTDTEVTAEAPAVQTLEEMMRDESNRIYQARFMRAIEELRLLGLVRTTQRKTDHVERLTF